MATELKVTIGSDVSRDYTTPQAAETGEQKDLTVSDEYFIGEMYADSDFTTGFAAITGWTTDATRNITFVPAVGEEHDGSEGSGVKLLNAGGATRAWRMYQQYTVIRSMEHDGNLWMQTENGANNNLFDRILAHDANTTNEPIRFYGSSDNSVARNCMVYNITTGAACGAASGANGFAEHCGAYNIDGNGFTDSGGVTSLQCDNCVAIDCGQVAGADFAVSGGGDYNCDSDTSAPGANSIHGKVAANQWSDPTGSPPDFNVKDASADIYHAAPRLASVTVDIVGYARPDPTSMGAFEYQSAPPTGQPTMRRWAGVPGMIPMASMGRSW